MENAQYGSAILPNLDHLLNTRHGEWHPRLPELWILSCGYRGYPSPPPMLFIDVSSGQIGLLKPTSTTGHVYRHITSGTTAHSSPQLFRFPCLLLRSPHHSSLCPMTCGKSSNSDNSSWTRYHKIYNSLDSRVPLIIHSRGLSNCA